MLTLGTSASKIILLRKCPLNEHTIPNEDATSSTSIDESQRVIFLSRPSTKSFSSFSTNCFSLSQKRSMEFDRAVPLKKREKNAIHFLESIYPSILQLKEALSRCDWQQSGINAYFWTAGEKRFWTLGHPLLLHTTWLLLTCLLLKRMLKNICSHSSVHFSPFEGFWFFCTFCRATNSRDFMPKSFTKYHIRVRRKFFKFVIAYNWNMLLFEEYLITTHLCVIWNKQAWIHPYICWMDLKSVSTLKFSLLMLLNINIISFSLEITLY